jgi:AraC-like DNA-binding protein
MRPFEATILPPPDILKEHVACIRIGEYSDDAALTINVSPNGVPGIVFQHHNGRSPVESIVRSTQRKCDIPTLYLYGQVTEPGVMIHRGGPYRLTQVLLKPHALHLLVGANAASVTNNIVGLNELCSEDLNDQLLEAGGAQDTLALLTRFLANRFEKAKSRDLLVEESLRLIHKEIGSVSVKCLREQLNISERHFERRFSQSVGVSPNFYIRVKRFNEAVRLMQRRHFSRFTDVAHALNYFDESHLIRDVKAFSGMTPKILSQKVENYDHDQVVYSYL